ncbi:hypothetical protein PanWU01x14_272230, partial [Parasponia andersonii]
GIPSSKKNSTRLIRGKKKSQIQFHIMTTTQRIYNNHMRFYNIFFFSNKSTVAPTILNHFLSISSSSSTLQKIPVHNLESLAKLKGPIVLNSDDFVGHDHLRCHVVSQRCKLRV